MTKTGTQIIHVNEMLNFPNSVYVGRGMSRQGLKSSIFCNPYKIGVDGDRATVIDRYTKHLSDLISMGNNAIIDELIALRGHQLACWCRYSYEEKSEGNRCHADVLAWHLDTYTDEQIRELGTTEVRSERTPVDCTDQSVECRSERDSIAE
jgi:hypothetical protein